jgi:hypothetical protein
MADLGKRQDATRRSSGPEKLAASAYSGVQGKTLDSWKEIAVFLHRTVRTVQRWEKTEGLPVRRHLHAQKGSVYALPAEVEKWREVREMTQHIAISSTPSLIASAAINTENLTRICTLVRERAARLRKDTTPESRSRLAWVDADFLAAQVQDRVNRMRVELRAFKYRVDNPEISQHPKRPS